MNIGINLLEPNKNTGSFIALRRIQKMRLFTIVLLFIISAFSVILFILVALSPLPALQRQEQSLRQTLSASNSTIAKLSIVTTQTEAINGLLLKRQSMEPPISLIQAKFTKDMKVEQLQVDKSSVLITVESPSLHSLDSFINGLVGYVQKKKTFSNLTLIDLTTDQATGAYWITVQLSYI